MKYVTLIVEHAPLVLKRLNPCSNGMKYVDGKLNSVMTVIRSS